MKIEKTIVLSVIFSINGCFVKAQNPAISPAWILGHVVWEDNLNSQKAVLDLVDGYLSRDIPVQGVVIDSPWSTGYNDFNWDTARYPNSVEMADMLKIRNVKPILWLTGAINYESKDAPLSKCDTYDYVVEQNYVVNDGKDFTWWKGKGVHIDFTNEKAKEWWYSQIDKVFDGFYGIKADAAEAHLGDSVMTSVGKMSNQEFRPYYYNAVYDYVTSRKPGLGIIYARPYQSIFGNNFADLTKMSIGWCGDYEGNFDGLKLQAEDILNSAIRGYCAVGCEIGGYKGEYATGETLIRYAQFASMTACMINGGANGSFTAHIPWWHGDEYLEIYRFYAILHQELLPYIFSTIVDCHLYGGTLLQNCSVEDLSYFFGPSIFTKAITSNQVTEFCLPQNGEYYDFFTDKIYQGGTKLQTPANLDLYPIYIKNGSVIPLNITSNTTGIGDEIMKGKKVIAIYSDTDVEHIIHWPSGDGIEYEDVKVMFVGGVIDITASNNNEYVLIIHNQDNVESIEGATSWNYDGSQKILKINAEGSNIRININNSDYTSIESPRLSSSEYNEAYNLNGVKVNGLGRGINIIRKQSDGEYKVLKIMSK